MAWRQDADPPCGLDELHRRLQCPPEAHLVRIRESEEGQAGFEQDRATYVQRRADDDRRQVRGAADEPARLLRRCRPVHRDCIEGRRTDAPGLVPQPAQGSDRLDRGRSEEVQCASLDGRGRLEPGTSLPPSLRRSFRHPRKPPALERTGLPDCNATRIQFRRGPPPPTRAKSEARPDGAQSGREARAATRGFRSQEFCRDAARVRVRGGSGSTRAARARCASRQTGTRCERALDASRHRCQRASRDR